MSWLCRFDVLPEGLCRHPGVELIGRLEGLHIADLRLDRLAVELEEDAVDKRELRGGEDELGEQVFVSEGGGQVVIEPARQVIWS